MNWRHQDFTGLALPGCPYPHAGHPIVCPNSFEAMKLAAVSLSKNIPFSRIDFYEVTGRMYFGEITLFPASGFGVFEPDNWNYTFGEKIDI